MSREHVSLSELLHSLDSAELQEVEQVRATLNQQLNTDRGGAVVSSLVEYYLDSLSSQAIVLLSSIREPHHKTLLEKLNDSLSRPGSRLAVLILLGHLIRKQPPWVHHISRSPLLTTLLRCLKTDTDVVVLITAVLVLITLLPMIPQAGKQHIYDFFDVFGRLASWSHKNPGHVPVVYLVHLHAGVYSLFHRLYGMFPCTFISYLRLHYSMKENLDTFQEVVKPMLEQVRVHPELVTGSQDYELEPTRWRCYEVHDIVIECSRLSLDPLESSCEDDLFFHTEPPLSSPKPPPLTSPLPQLNLSAGSSVCPPSGCQLPINNFLIQADDATWSPSSQCGLSTPPPETAATPTCCSVPLLCRITPPSGETFSSPAAAPVTSLTENICDGRLTPDNSNQVRTGQQVNAQSEKARGQSDVINNSSKEVTGHLLCRTSTPLRHPDLSGTAIHPPACSVSLCFCPLSRTTEMEVQSPVPPYDALFELALPQAAALFIRKKTKAVLERAAGEQEEEGGGEEDEQTFISPLEVLDQLIVHGHSAHEGLSRRLSAVNKSVDRSHFGGKQQSMKSKGPPQGEELQSLKSQLLLVHGQLQYERFKRQQHAVRNRRLLRRVINATALEEQGVAMRAQLSVQDDEIRCLKLSLVEEQRRFTQLQQETQTRGERLLTHVQQLLQERQDEHRDFQILQSELQECRSRMQDLEIELQKANNKADNAEQQLNQLSLKLCSSEQLQQQIFLLNQQLILLRETNRGLTELLDGGDRHHCTVDTRTPLRGTRTQLPDTQTLLGRTHTEHCTARKQTRTQHHCVVHTDTSLLSRLLCVSVCSVYQESTMLQCSVGNEYQQLKDSDTQHRQKLEATNHRIAELENQLAWKEQLILDQKKLLEDTSIQSRAELAACESRCSALSLLCRTLQTEMLQLYSQIHLDCRSNGSGASPALHGGCISQTSSSVGIKTGGVKVSTSPLHLASCSSSPLSLSPSPIESPLAVGSFLEKRARELFGPTNQSQEEESPRGGEEEEEAQRETTPPLQEAEESLLLTGSPEPQKQTETTVPPADLMPISQNRRQELTIMDYNESTPTTPAF